MVLIRLRGYTGWSAPLLFPYGKSRFSYDVAHLIMSHLCFIYFCLEPFKIIFVILCRAIQVDEMQADCYQETQLGFLTCSEWGNERLIERKLSCSMTKPTKWTVHPAKTQINLGIRPVWSVFAVSMKKPLRAQHSLCWVHVSLYCAVAQFNQVSNIFTSAKSLLRSSRPFHFNRKILKWKLPSLPL